MLVMNVLDGFEPCHLGIVDVVRLVVEDGQFVDLADNLSEVGLAVGGLARRLGTEGVREEVVAQVVVIQSGIGDVAKEDAMDVGEEHVSGVPHNAHIILNVQRELEVIAPVLALVPIVRQHGIIEENFQPVEIGRNGRAR
jgi:hypothetical protein